MITRGIVTEKIDNFTYRLNIPSLVDYETGGFANATVCSNINNNYSLNVGTAVFVDFENYGISKPVILGVIYNEKTPSMNSSLMFNSVNANGNASFFNSASIGDVTYKDIKNLGNVNKNIQKQIDGIEEDKDELKSSKEKESKTINNVNDSIEQITTNIESLDEQLDVIREAIGNVDDTKDTVYGRLNAIGSKLNSIDSFLKGVPKGKTAKKMTDELIKKIEEKRTSSSNLMPIIAEFETISSSDWIVKVDDKVMKNNYLTESQANNNIKCFYSIAKSYGWSDISICGMLGCIYNESNVNPGAQGLGEKYGWSGFNHYPTTYGIGLCMWTHQLHTDMVNYVNGNYGDWSDGNGQMEYLKMTVEDGGVKSKASATISQLDFIPSDLRFKKTIDMLTCKDSRWTLEMATAWWLACYEGGYGDKTSQSYYNSWWNDSYSKRCTTAKETYEYLSNM